MLAITFVGAPPSLAWPVAYWVEGRHFVVLVGVAVVVIRYWRLWRLVWRVLQKAFFGAAGLVAGDTFGEFLELSGSD